MCGSGQGHGAAAPTVARPGFAMPAKTGIAAAISGGSTNWLTGLPPKAPVAKAPQQRKKLWQLPRNLHCSVIGTCMPSPELRRVLERFADIDLRRISELELHEQGVTAAGRHDDAGRALHKALDRRHEVVLRKFARAVDAAQLRTLWLEAKQHGDLPGAYWATLTHAAAADTLVHEVFGDVHMLSHLVGAANRNALTRLSELDEIKAELETRLEKQQARIMELVAERDTSTRRLDDLLVARAAADAAPQDASEEMAALRALVESMRQRLAAESVRRERAEQKRDEARIELAQAQETLSQTTGRETALMAEVTALEGMLEGAESQGDERIHLPVPAGMVILYVGGRPAQVEEMRALTAASGAELLHHDGGLQERVGMLAGLISRADLIVFPVDCISHGAMHAVKRLCGQAGKSYLPLRSAGLASFVGSLANAPLPAEAEGTA